MSENDQHPYGSYNVLWPIEKPVIHVYHNKSTFFANAPLTYWNDGLNIVFQQKSMGQAIMVSDFIEEVDGFWQTGPLKAHVLLEHSKEDYFNNEKFLHQVQGSMGIFETKKPWCSGSFSVWQCTFYAFNARLECRQDALGTVKSFSTSLPLSKVVFTNWSYRIGPITCTSKSQTR